MNNLEKELLKQFGVIDFRKIQSVKIGIAGAGGLGSNCAFNLTRVGFKSFKIVDFDVIEYSNLNRQFFFYGQVGMKKIDALKVNLLLINPDISVETIDTTLAHENVHAIFDDCDILVEAFDKIDSKKMLIEEFLNSDKLLVSASGLAGFGDSNAIKTRQIKDNFFLVGDLISGVDEYNHPLSPHVNIAAAKQADVILEYVINKL